MPQVFIENKGQADERAKFYLRSGQQTLWLTRDGVVFDLLRAIDPGLPVVSAGGRRPRLGSVPRERLVFTQEFLDANRGVTIEPKELLPGTHNYYLGNDPFRWRRGARRWGEVVYRDIWAGIDLRLHSNGRHLEQEFIVSPGGDPSRVRVAYRGIEELRIAPDGALLIRTAFGELKESPPTIYQEIGGQRVAVTGRFKLLGPTAYTFEVGPYEPRYALVIDPTLVYAIYGGGSLDDNALGIAVDGDGHAYVAGSTRSTDFPTQNGLYSYSGGWDVFVARLNRAGTALQFSTYLGGTGDDTGPSIAIDATGAAYVVGSTTSTDFPTLNALQASSGGARDAFVARIDSSGALGYSTYLGGAGDDTGVGIAVDPSCTTSPCAVYVSGTTSTAFLPAQGAQPTFGGVRDAFVVKLDAAGSTLLASTYVGGGGAEDAGVLAVGTDGSVYLTGQTSSANFPTTSPLQSTLQGPADAFIVKLSANLSTRVYATYFGGTGTDGGNQIVVDATGAMYVVGQTNSYLNVVNAVQGAPGGGDDGFILKLDPTGSTIVYLTYLGGPGPDDASSIALDDTGSAYVTGMTAGGLPTNIAVDTLPQPTIGSGGGTGAYAAKLSPSGGLIQYLTYLGGATNEEEGMIAVDAAGSAYVALGSFAGGLAQDAYVAKLGTRSADLFVTMLGSPGVALSGGNLTYTITVHNAGPDQAINVKLSDTVPTGTTFQSLTPNAGCTTPAVNGTGAIDCALGTLAGGATVTLSLVVKVTTASGSVSNTATVRTLTPDPNFTNDAVTVTTTVATLGGISGTVCANGPPPCVAGPNPPINAATVSVYEGATGNLVQSYSTNNAGLYDTGQTLAPGLYKVTASFAGSEPIAYNNKFSVAAGDPVTVAAGQTTAGIDFALPLLGAISGTVCASAPPPCVAGTNPAIAGAVVDVWDYGTNVFITSATTDANGNYTIANLNPLQAYRVRARQPGGAATNYGMVFANGQPSAGTADVVTPLAGGSTTQNFALGPAGGIIGKVVDAVTGLPISGVVVDVIDGASTNFSINNFLNFGPTTSAGPSPPTGVFSTGRVLTPGVYKLRARKVGSGYIQTFYPSGFDLSTAATVTVTGGADIGGPTSAPTIVIAMQPGGTITGTIRDRASNAPIQGASVAAQRVASSGFFGDFTVTTDASGNYTITGLHSGEWLIYAQAAGHMLGWNSGDANNPATDFSSTTPVQITGANTVSGVNINLQPGGGEIRGRITRTDNSQPVLPGTPITIWGPWPRSSTITQVRALTNNQGDYSFSGILPGRYFIQAERNQLTNGNAIGFFPLGAVSRASGTFVTVTEGGVVTADFQVLGMTGGQSPRAIRGTLKDASNNPIRNAFILASEPTGGSLVRVGIAQDDGSFFVDGLAPGRYLLSIQTEHTFTWSAYPAELTLETATQIDVTAGDVTGINWVVPNNAGTITGRVTRSDTGQPVLGAAISVRTFLDGAVAGAASQADGTYLVRGATPGFYKLRVSAPGFVTKFFSVNVPSGALTVEDGSFVEVTAGTNTPSINVVLAPTGGALTGTVKKQGTLEPVVATIVGIRDATTGNRVLSVLTDASGAWRTESLGPGSYKVGAADIQSARGAVRYYNGKATLLDADTVGVAAAGVTGGVDLLISPSQGSVSGQVLVNPGSTPLPNAGVEILDAATGGYVRRALTGSDGRYSAQGLAPGSNLYVAHALDLGYPDQYYNGVTTRAAATPLTVTNGGDRPNVNFTLGQRSADLSVTMFANPSPALSGGVLTYTITVRNNSADPAESVTLIDTVPAGATFQRVSPTLCATPPVNGSGTVTCSLGTIAGGASVTLTMVVNVTAQSGSVTNTATVATSASDPGSADNSVTVVTAITSPGSITGTVCANTGPPCAAGNPAIAGATITIYYSDSPAQVTTWTTNSNGGYTIGGLYPRSYRVSAQANGFVTRFFNGQVGFTSANAVTVGPGGTAAANFALPGGAGGISGRVTDGITGVPNAMINVRTVGGDIVLNTVTDSNGNYNTQLRLAVGTYFVRAAAAGRAVTYYASATSAATATPVTVVASGTTGNINIQLTSGAGGISGRITNAATGGPLANAGVFISDGATNGIANSYLTDATGRYDTGQTLKPGVYKVNANAAGFENTAYNNRFSTATGDPVTVTTASTTSGIDLALPPLGSITGHVRNAADNSPIGGAVVDVWDYASNGFLTSATTASSGDVGSYTISNLNPLQGYRVRARVNAGAAANFGMVFYNNKPSAGAADVVRVPAGGTSTIDFLITAAGGIKGQVTDAVTTLPISGVSIDVIDGASTNLSINNFLNFAVVTDASGNFDTGRILAPGAYKLRARKVNSGYIQTFYHTVPNGFDLSTAATLTVTAGVDMLNANIAMVPGGTITGTIRDRVTSQPISGANVTAQRFASSSFFVDNFVTTNASGVFTITGLHPGEWLITAVAAGHMLGWYSGGPNNLALDFAASLPIQITGTNTVSTVDLNLQPGGGEIRGRITRSDDNQPVPLGTAVNIRGPWPRTGSIWNFAGGPIGSPPFTLFTDADGNYSFSGLPSGRYVVEANRVQVANGTAIGFYPFGSISRASAVPVTVADGAVVTADFQVFGFSGGETPRAIRGTLKDPSNNPIRNAFPFVFEPTGNGFVRTGTVFDDGSFIVDGLAPGLYTFNANTETTFVSTNFPAEPTLGTATVIDLTAGDANGINLVLPNNAGTITGTVTRSDAPGQPVLGASISVRMFLDASVVGATSRVDGTYLVRGVPPGSYKVRVSAPGFVTKFFKVGVPAGGLTIENGSFVAVTAGTPTPNINVVLDPTGGALTGTVRDQSTLQPVVATLVAIHDAASGERVMVVSTDANGTWITEGLGPGTYKVQALDFLAARHAGRWYNGGDTLLTADPVTVASVGTTGGIDFLVSANRGAISGQVSKSDATPLANAVVTVLDSATGGLVRRALVGSTGAYSAQGLAPGSDLYVAEGRALGFADKFFPNGPSKSAASPLTVAGGATTPSVNLVMTASADITGSVSYAGAQTGALIVRLFSDDAYTQQVYETVIPSPSFGAGQAYGFALAAPDSRGLVPGTYYVKAFLDSNGNGFQDATEAVGTAGQVILAEGATAAGVNVTIVNPAATTNTPPVADAQSVIFVQGTSNNSILLTGLDAQTATPNLAYAVVTNPLHGTLATTANPQVRLYTPNPSFVGPDSFTFTVTDRGDPDNCGAPGPSCAASLTSAAAAVTIQVIANAGVTSKGLAAPAITAPPAGSTTPQPIGNVEINENAAGALIAGSAVKLGLPAGLTFAALPTVSFNVGNGAVLNPPVLESPGVVSFTLAAGSTQGKASILVSSMSVLVAAGFLSGGVTEADVLTTVYGPNPGLLGQSVSVKNAIALSPAAPPALTDVAPGRGAQGVLGRVVTLTGANFAADATASFGPGVTVASATVDSSGTQITATVNIGAGAALGLRDVIVTNVGAGQSVTKVGAFQVTAPPAIASATGPNTDGSLSVNLPNQLMTITGTNFQSATTTPSDLLVSIAGAGITVVDVGYTSQTTITAVVSVADAALTTYNVTVTNPDGGSATGVGIISVSAATGGSAPPPKSGGSPPPPPPPSITSLTPTASALGTNIVVAGSGLSATATSNSVTFAGAGGTRVSATVTAATTTQLTVTVPTQATTGNVTVAVGGVVSNGAGFTVTNPVLTAVLPTSGTQGAIASLTLSGLRFAPGASVGFSGQGDIVNASNPSVAADGTSIQASVSIAPGATVGARDVKVTNPDGTSSTLAGAFQVKAPIVAGFLVTLPAFPDAATYLPSVGGVSVTRDATGLCTAKTITPTAVQVQAQFTTTDASLTAPPSVTFTIASSGIPGTASNETCEAAPYSGASPSPDWSIGAPSLASQSVVVAGNGGIYTTTLYSYDWGGKVTITVTGATGSVTATGTLALPVDADGDDLPDAYEKNTALNADLNGVNVLNFQNPDQNGNGIKDRDDRFARDGLTNFEKYRGIYLVGPGVGQSGAMGGFQRLGAGFRHLFVRGRGFRDDPAVPAGFCGINPATGAPVADASFCPAFQVGAAFQNIGVAVHNVSGSFTAATELPRTSYASPATPTLDMATVIYDGLNCKGSEACDTISKFGVRQWGFTTLGYTTPYGTVSAYGTTTIYKRAIDSYFNARPYQHRTNDPTRVVTASDGRPMLAPITRVGDSAGTGADNGLIDTGDATVSGQLSGDTYIAGSFNQHLSALDVNNDGCIENPTVADPTTIERCTPTADTAASPSATKQQVGRSVITHELGHTAGINGHTNDATDIMYMSTINFIRDGHFSDAAAALVQIHNKGIQ